MLSLMFSIAKSGPAPQVKTTGDTAARRCSRDGSDVPESAVELSGQRSTASSELCSLRPAPRVGSGLLVGYSSSQSGRVAVKPKEDISRWCRLGSKGCVKRNQAAKRLYPAPR